MKNLTKALHSQLNTELLHNLQREPQHHNNVENLLFSVNETYTNMWMTKVTLDTI